MSGNPIRFAESFSHVLSTQGEGLGPGAEIILTVEWKDGPRITDYVHALSVKEARTLAENLLQSITDTEARADPQPVRIYPTPPEDLALHLYGLPYGEEFTT